MAYRSVLILNLRRATLQRAARKTLLSAFGALAIATLFVAAVGPEPALAAVIDWQLSITASTATQGGNNNLTLGVSNIAHDSFDGGIDVPHPPQGPAASFDAYFPLADPIFSELDKDFRGESSSIQWTLRVTSTAESVTLTWNPTGLPQDVTLTLTGDGQDTDMKAVSKVVISPGTFALTVVAVQSTNGIPPEGGTTVEPAPEPGLTALGAYTDADGIFKVAVAVGSADGNATLSIAEGVLAKAEDGSPLTSIKIVIAGYSPPPPSGSIVVSPSYEMKPDGATFSPAASLTISYDATRLPQGTNANTIAIARWNSARSHWEPLESAVDKMNSSVTSLIDRLGTYALIGKTVQSSAQPSAASPIQFAVSDLEINPSTVSPGQTVSISVEVSNAGIGVSDYNVVLRIDGTTAGTKTVWVDPSSSVLAAFSVSSDDPGIHQVDVNRTKGTFTVNGTLSARQTATVASVSAGAAPTTGSPGVSWLIVGLIVLGVVIIGGLVYLIAHT